jgi:hypothetical protein
MLKQGKPDGPDAHYQVHLLDRTPETAQRDIQLANKDAKALCRNGSWHKWFASKADEVTCPECLKHLTKSGPFFVGIGDDQYPMIVSGPFEIMPKLQAQNHRLFVKFGNGYRLVKV